MVLPPVLRRPSVDLPGMVVETDVDEGAKVMAPQRPRTGNPRQALWHSSGNCDSLSADRADTVTTERLGTISKSGRLLAEYPQRPGDASVFDADTTDETSPDRVVPTERDFDLGDHGVTQHTTTAMSPSL